MTERRSQEKFEISVSLSYARTGKGLTCCLLIRRQGRRVEGCVGKEGWKKERDPFSFFRATFKQFSSTRGIREPVAPLI